MSQNHRVGIYLRLSKEDEKLGESGSITNQRAILLSYIKENQLEFVEEYVDDGVSGTTFNRIGFRRMIQDIEAKKIDMVITKDTSRLGRDHIEFGYYVEKYFPEHNVRYVAVCDQIDTFSNHNDMLLFKSAYNDMYVKDISNKIRASLNIKKRNGEFVGAYAPYGYQKDLRDKHKLVIDEDAARVVKRIFQLFLEGYSITKIALILTGDNIPIPSIHKGMNRGLKSSLFGIWTTRTITDILTNPTYMGNLTQGRNKKVNYKSKKRVHTKKETWITKENSCPAIVDKYLFEMVQKLYLANKNNYCSRNCEKEHLLLRGLVFCAECGHTIGFRSVFQKTKDGKNIRRIYGNCNYYLKHKSFRVCTPHSISYLQLESLILENVKRQLARLNMEKITTRVRQLGIGEEGQKELDKKFILLQKELDLSKLKLDRLYEDKLGELIDKECYVRMKKKINEDIQNIQDELKVICEKRAECQTISYENLILELLNKERPNQFLWSSLIEKITLSEEGNVTIYYKIKENKED